MSGWTAMAGTHDFRVDGDTAAEDLAAALAAYGFPHVFARTHPDGGWTVQALDEGPYPADAVGHRQFDAVGRAAAEIARTQGGRPDGGSRFDISRVPAHRESTAPIQVHGTRTRPPVPEIVIVPAPPAADLVLVPDPVIPGAVDLAGLDDVPWGRLEHAYGAADDVPEMLRQLADGTGDPDEIFDELFGAILHQGDCYPATAYAMPFLARLVVADAAPASLRLRLVAWLVIAGGRRNDNLVGFAGPALDEGVPVAAGAWTEEVYQAVDAEVPALLSRWDTEPPAVRFVLAMLAGQHPAHGVRVADRVATMAAEYEGTQQGAYLAVAENLVRGRDEEALAGAAAIVRWADRLEPEWLDAPVPAGVRAAHVLAEGGLLTVR